MVSTHPHYSIYHSNLIIHNDINALSHKNHIYRVKNTTKTIKYNKLFVLAYMWHEISKHIKKKNPNPWFKD